MTFPSHKFGLFLTHNEHRDYYQSMEGYLSEEFQAGWTWESEDSKRRAISTDECWHLQWFPRSPGTSYICAAPTLEEVLLLALSIEKHEQP